ncbi:hypothetical protein FH972_014685 [Carpinus fangiana]|uniref:TF-B3 domain-containing protein n=1 Tax=Carpinus fangiana TaxID=176857 RepID=A0A5N6RB40_9ROSI|nr:hypothetical protein FH972_014685 [Carpinus fangiana]
MAATVGDTASSGICPAWPPNLCTRSTSLKRCFRRICHQVTYSKMVYRSHMQPDSTPLVYGHRSNGSDLIVDDVQMNSWPTRFRRTGGNVSLTRGWSRFGQAKQRREIPSPFMNSIVFTRSWKHKSMFEIAGQCIFVEVVEKLISPEGGADLLKRSSKVEEMQSPFMSSITLTSWPMCFHRSGGNAYLTQGWSWFAQAKQLSERDTITFYELNCPRLLHLSKPAPPSGEISVSTTSHDIYHMY